MPPKLQPVPVGPQPHAPHVHVHVHVGHGRAAQRLTLPLTTLPSALSTHPSLSPQLGTVVLLIGYLVVFISVPIMEVAFMRHTTVTSKEVSQVLKLVGFQILATLSTIGSFVGDTNGANSVCQINFTRKRERAHPLILTHPLIGTCLIWWPLR